MFCKRVVLVNWGNIPNLEFDFGPVNLFSGGNGSGKTTAADALQSLMTAAHENLFTYNPGQDETTQRGRGGKQVRTLASYVLGCDDGSYSRPRTTDGYIAGVFHPTQGESAEPFTAVMCVRASLDSAGSSRQARQDELLFLVLPHEQLGLDDFVRRDKTDKYIVPITQLTGLLKKQYGLKVVEAYDKKGPYLRRLYGALKGSKTSVSDREAKHAARTFANFMAYKPVKSITEFVAKEVLDARDLSDDIRQVSELMKTIHGMEEDTRQVNDAITNLDNAQNCATAYVDDWVALRLGEYSELSRRLLLKQNDYLQQKKLQNSNQTDRHNNQEKLSSNNAKKTLLHSQLVSLEAQRQGIEALKTKDQLEADINRLSVELGSQARPLLEQDQQFSANIRQVQLLANKLKEVSLGLEVPALQLVEFRQQLNKMIALGDSSGIDVQFLLNKDLFDSAALENKIEALAEVEACHQKFADLLHQPQQQITGVSVRDQVLQVLNQRKSQQEKAGQQLKTKQHEIQKLENHAVSYPAYVEAAVLAINNQCPLAKPSVLCDFIEVIDAKWQMAIEGFIGGARFSIIVEPEYEAQAIAIVRNIKGRRNNARVIQGAKAQRDAAKQSLPKDSIVEVMEFDHKIVEYYVKASYGSVLRVTDEQALTRARRGLMASGLGSSNYSMFRCDIDDADLVFGQGARERALLAKQQQQQLLQQQSDAAELSHRQVGIIYDAIDNIKTVRCTDIIQAMLDLYRQSQHAENQLANLDLSDFRELEEKVISLNAQQQELLNIGNELSEELGRLKEKENQYERLIAKLADDKDQLQTQQESEEQAVLNITKVYVEFDANAALTQANEAVQQARAEFSFVESNARSLQQLDKHERALHDVILQHNQMGNAYNAIMYHTGNSERNGPVFFKHIVNLTVEIKRIYNSLKNNVLVGKYEKIASLKESFNTAFVTNLCHSIYQSINEGKRILDDLNKELEHHRFGEDRERFYFGYDWLPEFKEYQLFFKEVINTPNLGDGATLFDAQLSSKSCMVRDKLLDMLLDKDEQIATRELKRISDYRNYRRYEIYKEPLNKAPIALSTYGTGSGGQLETPAYIIRAAAVTSAFRFNEGNSHCRMVLVDEAFSKMDENRSREVINYLTQTLGLQLLFIMPTSKSGPFMDLISNQVVFSKCPTVEKIGELNTRVLVDRKACNQDKIKELWAQHRQAIRSQGSLDFMEEFG